MTPLQSFSALWSPAVQRQLKYVCNNAVQQITHLSTNWAQCRATYQATTIHTKHDWAVLCQAPDLLHPQDLKVLF